MTTALEWEPQRDKELTTTQAALLAGVSRQHLVDLCDQGALPYRKVGAHRRVRRDDVVEILGAPSQSEQRRLTRKDKFSLALHSLVVCALLRDEDTIRDRGRANLQTLRRADVDGAATPYLDAWDRLLSGDLEALLGTLTGLSDAARDLRNVTPFAGVVPDAERRELIATIR